MLARLELLVSTPFYVAWRKHAVIPTERSEWSVSHGEQIYYIEALKKDRKSKQAMPAKQPWTVSFWNE